MDSNHRFRQKETALERDPAADHCRLARRPVLNDLSSLSVRDLLSATAERPFARAELMVRIHFPPAKRVSSKLGLDISGMEATGPG